MLVSEGKSSPEETAELEKSDFWILDITDFDDCTEELEFCRCLVDENYTVTSILKPGEKGIRSGTVVGIISLKDGNGPNDRKVFMYWLEKNLDDYPFLAPLLDKLHAEFPPEERDNFPLYR